MSQLKVFYAVYVPTGPQRTILDAMRLFARPNARHPAHITVRGPYPDYRDPRAWSAVVRGKPVDVGGVGCFIEPDQSTVFLRVDSPAVLRVWDKPDYPDSFPHLTIFDGRGADRPFAESVRDVLSNYDPRFGFEAGGLEPMALGNGPGPLIAYYDPKALAEFLDTPPAAAQVASADADTRLRWIAGLAEHLSAAGCGT